LHEPAPVTGEELQLDEQEEQAGTGRVEREPNRRGNPPEQDAPLEVSPAPLVDVPSGGEANETTRLRRGFLKQLFSRLSPGEK